MTTRKLTPRTRQMLLVSLITFCWTLAAASAFAGSVSHNNWWYIAAIVFFVNGFVPFPFLHYLLALGETPGDAHATLLGRTPPDKKRIALATLCAFSWVMSAGCVIASCFAQDGAWHIEAISFFISGLVFFGVLRKLRTSEADSERPAASEQ